MPSASGKCPVRRIRPRQMSAMGTEPCGPAAGDFAKKPGRPRETALEHALRFHGAEVDLWTTPRSWWWPSPLLAILAVVWMVMQQRRRAHLKDRFGPEYDQALRRHPDARVAERELLDRERRVATFDIKPLTRDDAARFSEAWRVIQARFVDDPKEAVVDADRLVDELMRALRLSHRRLRAARGRHLRRSPARCRQLPLGARHRGTQHARRNQHRRTPAGARALSRAVCRPAGNS